MNEDRGKIIATGNRTYEKTEKREEAGYKL